MEQLGYSNAQQVTAMGPGVQTVQPNGEANYSIAIRGVASSDFTTNVESPVAVSMDDVYISQMSGTTAPTLQKLSFDPMYGRLPLA